MSSRASIKAMYHLVEQLKLEASVEKIKVLNALLAGISAGSNCFQNPRFCALF
ncbi:unnamed protein product [Nyctereutes procyonoides]|uniref:(raccoon dog) hypothetical protein n=1 Tax=Nyctereutes procyonoides TaxID=34880 RepID=A0A811YHU7_NYCPR|nr:unnamed protein product [Nyctereutes procyonoides]